MFTIDPKSYISATSILLFTCLFIYIYKSETGWLGVFVCVLLGDGGLLPCSGGVLFGQF
jgi:hypothetical protein